VHLAPHLIAWMGSEQAMTDAYQQHATAPSLPQREQQVSYLERSQGIINLLLFSLYSIISVSDCICNHQGTGYKAQACS